MAHGALGITRHVGCSVGALLRLWRKQLFGTLAEEDFANVLLQFIDDPVRRHYNLSKSREEVVKAFVRDRRKRCTDEGKVCKSIYGAVDLVVPFQCDVKGLRLFYFIQDIVELGKSNRRPFDVHRISLSLARRMASL